MLGARWIASEYQTATYNNTQSKIDYPGLACDHGRMILGTKRWNLRTCRAAGRQIRCLVCTKPGHFLPQSAVCLHVTIWPFRNSLRWFLQAKNRKTQYRIEKGNDLSTWACWGCRRCRLKGASVRVTESLQIISSEKLMQCLTVLFVTGRRNTTTLILGHGRNSYSVISERMRVRIELIRF